MNISGRFTTLNSTAALAGLPTAPESLESVSTLHDVGTDDSGDVVATFVPVTALGRFVLRVAIRAVSYDGDSARLRVVGSRGQNVVTVDIALAFTSAVDGTAVTWDAEVLVHGPVASVGQRVARDVARQVIGEVLAETAAVAKEPV